MKKKLKIAVLISGSGTNLQALIDLCKEENIPAEITLVISNKADAYGLVRAQNSNIKTEVISHKDYKNRAEFDQKIHQILLYNKIDFVCLAGFMRLLTKEFVDLWPEKIINIHPSLLPDFKGVDAIKQALDAKVKVTGCTVHFVTPIMDDGPIIIQESVTIEDKDTLDSLSEKVHKAEHRCYKQALKTIVSKQNH